MCIKVIAANFAFYAINSSPAAYYKDNAVRGYYADILARVAQELGISDVKITLAPYPRIVHELNSNTQGFVLTCLFPSGLFNQKVHQPSHVGLFQTGIISMQNSPINWDNIQGKRVATVKGASEVYGSKFHDKVTNGEITLVSVTDYSQALKMLSTNRIDGFAGNLGPILSAAKSENIPLAPPAVITEKRSMITVSVALGTPDGDKMVAKIGKIVSNLLKTGEIQDIIEKYLPEDKQPR
jgi:ABC-type amino acid transport substrate-binding protein